MSAPAFCFFLVACLTFSFAAPAPALTVDQVIALRKAGISNELIQKLIDNEIAAQAQGGVGRYVVKQSGGSEMIVYQASSPRGVVEYPLPKDAYEGGGVNRLGAALNIESRDPYVPRPTAKKAMAKKSPAGGYTLHLSSYRKEASAQKDARALSGKGVDARIVAVDLGAKGRWYRVLVGKYSKKSQAQSAGASLKAAGSIPSYLVIHN